MASNCGYGGEMPSLDRIFHDRVAAFEEKLKTDPEFRESIGGVYGYGLENSLFDILYDSEKQCYREIREYEECACTESGPWDCTNKIATWLFGDGKCDVPRDNIDFDMEFIELEDRLRSTYFELDSAAQEVAEAEAEDDVAEEDFAEALAASDAALAASDVGLAA